VVKSIGGDFVNIIIYTTATCPYCQMLEDFLKSKNISFTKKLVDQDDDAQKEMMSESDGFLGVPFTVITKTDGVKEKVIGFDQGRFNDILG
jgi:glutaredoxin 3